MTSHNLDLDNDTANIYDNNNEIICTVSIADLDKKTDVDQTRLGVRETRNNLSSIISYLNKEGFGLYKDSDVLELRNENTGLSIAIEANLAGNAKGLLEPEQVKNFAENLIDGNRVISKKSCDHRRNSRHCTKPQTPACDQQ